MKRMIDKKRSFNFWAILTGIRGRLLRCASGFIDKSSFIDKQPNWANEITLVV